MDMLQVMMHVIAFSVKKNESKPRLVDVRSIVVSQYNGACNAVLYASMNCTYYICTKKIVSSNTLFIYASDPFPCIYAADF